MCLTDEETAILRQIIEDQNENDARRHVLEGYKEEDIEAVIRGSLDQHHCPSGQFYRGSGSPAGTRRS